MSRGRSCGVSRANRSLTGVSSAGVRYDLQKNVSLPHFQRASFRRRNFKIRRRLRNLLRVLGVMLILLLIPANDDLLEELFFRPAPKGAASISVRPVSSPSASSGQTVWISGPNGRRYHSVPSCSGMKSPEPLSQEDAWESGYTPCQICCSEL